MAAGQHTRGRSDGGPVLLALALGCAGLLLLLLALAARTAPSSPLTEVPSFGYPSAPAAPPGEGYGAPRQEPSVLPEPAPPPAWAAPLAEALVLLVVVVAVLVAAAVVVLVVRGVRARQRPVGIEDDVATVVDVAEVREHLARSQTEIDVDGDVNRAVVRCWQGLERLAAAVGAPRAAHQTAREYTVAVLAAAALPEGPVHRLADVYEDALFSGTRLPESARRTALAALTTLREATEQQDAGPAPSAWTAPADLPAGGPGDRGAGR
ncbi:DUF4129 domain-containing protein [Desertihabitans brevis]|uniref:DUF4129 domain-containing protein n=2 Tax=Desertihabitans brevis TaxID=2268447 RepID=A0A367YUW4_9ACTN|nr:DUF4129 domain-containing protein [Desertihabitans brevis]